MSIPQLELLYGLTSPFNDSSALERLRRLVPSNVSSATKSDFDRRLRDDLRQIALADRFDLTRQRDASINSPIVLAPTVGGTSVGNAAILSWVLNELGG